MVSRQVSIDYSDMALEDMPSLKIALENDYINQNDTDYKIDSISIRSYPLVMNPALKTLVKENRKNNYIISKSYVERIGLLFGISKLSINPVITEIIERDSDISTSTENEDVWEELENINRISYATKYTHKKINISSFYWVKQWIAQNSTELGFYQSDLMIYCLLHGLSYYPFKNRLILRNINAENDHFMNYITKRCILIKGKSKTSRTTKRTKVQNDNRTKGQNYTVL